MELRFAKSLSGHDKEEIYMVVDEDKKNMYLVNGTTRTIDSPKRKNIKHVQIIKKLPDEVTEILDGAVTDLSIKRAIKIYNRRNQ